jgi:hypothetical protein
MGVLFIVWNQNTVRIKKMHLYAGFKNIEKRTIGEKRTFVIKYRNSGYHQPQHRKLFLFDYHSSNMSMPPYLL